MDEALIHPDNEEEHPGQVPNHQVNLKCIEDKSEVTKVEKVLGTEFLSSHKSLRAAENLVEGST